MIGTYRIFAVLFIALGIGSMLAIDLVSPVQVAENNVTLIQKTDPHWPARGAISVDPCFNRICLDI